MLQSRGAFERVCTDHGIDISAESRTYLDTLDDDDPVRIARLSEWTRMGIMVVLPEPTKAKPRVGVGKRMVDGLLSLFGLLSE